MRSEVGTRAVGSPPPPYPLLLLLLLPLLKKGAIEAERCFAAAALIWLRAGWKEEEDGEFVGVVGEDSPYSSSYSSLLCCNSPLTVEEEED